MCIPVAQYWLLTSNRWILCDASVALLEIMTTIEWRRYWHHNSLHRCVNCRSSLTENVAILMTQHDFLPSLLSHLARLASHKGRHQAIDCNLSRGNHGTNQVFVKHLKVSGVTQWQMAEPVLEGLLSLHLRQIVTGNQRHRLKTFEGSRSLAARGTMVWCHQAHAADPRNRQVLWRKGLRSVTFYILWSNVLPSLITQQHGPDQRSSGGNICTDGMRDYVEGFCVI